MRIAILGAGAMGSWFGGLLALQGQSVQLLTTNEDHRTAIKQNGLLLKAPEGDTTVSIDVHAPNEMTGSVDLVMLMTKTFQTTQALASITHNIDDNTHILSLQNGLGNAENIAQFVALDRVWVGVSMMPIDKVAPGVVAGKGQGSSYFGNATHASKTSMATAIESTFNSAGIELHHDENIHQRIWEKVAFNSGMNALSALTNGRPGTIGRYQEAKTLAINVAKEVVEVALACDITLDFSRIKEMIELSVSKHAEHIPSMLQDMHANRQTEVDALSGAVTRMASKSGIATPLNHTLTTLIKLKELSNEEYA